VQELVLPDPPPLALVVMLVHVLNAYPIDSDSYSSSCYVQSSVSISTDPTIPKWLCFTTWLALTLFFAAQAQLLDEHYYKLPVLGVEFRD